MSEKTPPNVKQTMSEKVLIKYQALSADRYHTIITQQAQKRRVSYTNKQNNSKKLSTKPLINKAITMELNNY
ncbi:hypothetical protein AB6H32_02340 [Providencia hangzhouensis]